MKSKASLVLMEMLVMVLVFALAAGLCLQSFAKAREISDQTSRKDAASLLAQNAAELLKATGGDVEKAGSLSEGSFHLEIRKEDPQIPGLGQAEISVYDGELLLLSLRIGWQEAIP